MRALSCGASCLQKRAAQGDPAWECRAGRAERSQRQWDSLLPCHRNRQLSQQVLGRAGRRPLILPEHASSRESSEGQTLRQGRSQQAKAATWRGRHVLAPPGSPLPPAATHELQGGGCGQLAPRPALPLSGTRKRFVQPDTSLSGISATPERASNGGSVTHVPQVPLPAQTCPGAHCLRSKGSINSLGRHLWPFHPATTNPSRKTSF